MRDLDYRPSALARSLKSGRTDTIGLVVPDVTNPFFAGVVKGAESVAQGTDYQLVLCNTDESSDREHAVLSTIRGRVDGLLLAPARDDAETSESLADLGVPIVLVDRTLPDPGDADAVLIDNAGGAAAAARLLIDDGHLRIGFVSGPLDTTPGAERHAQFRRRVRGGRCRGRRRGRRLQGARWLPGRDAVVRRRRPADGGVRRQQSDVHRAAAGVTRPRAGGAAGSIGRRLRRSPPRRSPRSAALGHRPRRGEPGCRRHAHAARPSRRATSPDPAAPCAWTPGWCVGRRRRSGTLPDHGCACPDPRRSDRSWSSAR